MSETQGQQRSAVVFGARNLGRAVIELLVSDGWAVTGVARSQSTLDGVSAAGGLAPCRAAGDLRQRGRLARAVFSFLGAGGRGAVAPGSAAAGVQAAGGSARR